MIKAIIFDLGGVVFTEGAGKAMQKLKEKYGLSEELLKEIFIGKASKDLRNDLITTEEFLEYLKSKLPENIDPKEVINIWHNSYILKEDTIDLINKLRQKYKIAALSGNTRERVEFLEKKYEFKRYFDVIVFSFEIKTNKPDRKAWDTALERLKLKPEECIFIDDHQYYVDKGNELGIKSILFKDIEQLKKEMEVLVLSR